MLEIMSSLVVRTSHISATTICFCIPDKGGKNLIENIFSVIKKKFELNMFFITFALFTNVKRISDYMHI